MMSQVGELKVAPLLAFVFARILLVDRVRFFSMLCLACYLMIVLTHDSFTNVLAVLQ